MAITWDVDKARINRRDHKIAFSDAKSVFADPMGLVWEDADAQGEQRHIVLGLDHLGRLLLVTYSYRGQDDIRLISARKALPHEAKDYARI